MKKIKLFTSLSAATALGGGVALIATGCSCGSNNNSGGVVKISNVKWYDEATGEIVDTPILFSKYIIDSAKITQDSKILDPELLKSISDNGSDPALGVQPVELEGVPPTVSITPTSAGEKSLKLKAEFYNDETKTASTVYTVEYIVTVDDSTSEPAVVCTEAKINGKTLANPLQDGCTLLAQLRNNDFIDFRLKNVISSLPIAWSVSPALEATAATFEPVTGMTTRFTIVDASKFTPGATYTIKATYNSSEYTFTFTTQSGITLGNLTAGQNIKINAATSHSPVIMYNIPTTGTAEEKNGVFQIKASEPLEPKDGLELVVQMDVPGVVGAERYGVLAQDKQTITFTIPSTVVETTGAIPLEIKVLNCKDKVLDYTDANLIITKETAVIGTTSGESDTEWDSTNSRWMLNDWDLNGTKSGDLTLGLQGATASSWKFWVGDSLSMVELKDKTDDQATFGYNKFKGLSIDTSDVNAPKLSVSGDYLGKENADGNNVPLKLTAKAYSGASGEGKIVKYLEFTINVNDISPTATRCIYKTVAESTDLSGEWELPKFNNSWTSGNDEPTLSFVTKNSDSLVWYVSDTQGQKASGQWNDGVTISGSGSQTSPAVLKAVFNDQTTPTGYKLNTTTNPTIYVQTWDKDPTQAGATLKSELRINVGIDTASLTSISEESGASSGGSFVPYADDKQCGGVWHLPPNPTYNTNAELSLTLNATPNSFTISTSPFGTEITETDAPLFVGASTAGGTQSLFAKISWPGSEPRYYITENTTVYIQGRDSQNNIIFVYKVNVKMPNSL